MKNVARLLPAVCFFIHVAGADAALITSEISLDALQSVPANPSTATGTATVEFDTAGLTLNLSLSVIGISLADVTFPGGGLAFGGIGPVHIHEAAAGSTGPVVVPFPDAVDYTDTASGFDLSSSGVSFASTLLPAITSGAVYLNVHTLTNPSGEIRGQLVPSSAVPLPPTSFVLATGLLAMIFRTRRGLRALA